MKTLRHALSSFTLAAALLGGCGSSPSSPDGGDDGGAIADGGLEGPCLRITPGPLDFGNVGVNTTAKLTLNLTNLCAMDRFEPIPAPGGADAPLFTTVPGAGTSITLKSQQSMAITVAYSPIYDLPSPSAAFLSFTDGCASCLIVVDLRGIPLDGCMAFDATSLNFGGVAVGTTVTKTLTLTNPCTNAPISMVADPAVLNTDSSGAMTPAGAFQPGTPFPTYGTIAPGQSVEIPVSFTPPATGAFYGQIDLRFDDPTHSDPLIPIAGAGQ